MGYIEPRTYYLAKWSPRVGGVRAEAVARGVLTPVQGALGSRV